MVHPSLILLVVSAVAPVASARPLPAQEPAPEAEASAAEAGQLPLRVEDVVALVARNAPAVRQARLSALAASAGVTEARGIFDPVFFADATYSYLEQPTSGFFSTFFDETETTTVSATQGLRGQLLTGATYSVSLREQDQSANFLTEDQSDVSLNLDFTQPLLRGGWELVAEQQVRSAEIGRRRGFEGVRQAATDTVQEAIDAYWDLAFAIADVEVKQFGLELAEEQKAVTEARFEVGSVAEVEVVQTEASIASRRDDLLTAENVVRQQQDRLRILITGDEDTDAWQVDLVPISALPEAVPTEVAWRDALKVALEQRADLRQARLDIEQADLDWRVAERNDDPKLDLVLAGNAFGQDSEVIDAFEPVGRVDFPGYSIGLVFELPLGNRQYLGARERARWNWLLRVRQYRDLEKQVVSEVRDAVRAINFLAARVAATAAATRVAERQLDAEQRRLREGVSTNFQVLEFQNDLLTAKTAELGARMSYAKAVSKLNTVQGLQWDGAGVALPDGEHLEDQAAEDEAAAEGLND